MDIISVDVPLFIRLLEYAREDSTNDVQLHDLTERLVSANGRTLTMDDYDALVSGLSEKASDSNNSGYNHSKSTQTSPRASRAFDGADDEIGVDYTNGLASIKASILNRLALTNDGEFPTDGPSHSLTDSAQPFVGNSRKGDMNLGSIHRRVK